MRRMKIHPSGSARRARHLAWMPPPRLELMAAEAISRRVNRAMMELLILVALSAKLSGRRSQLRPL